MSSTCKFGLISIAVLDTIALGGPMVIDQVAKELGLTNRIAGRSVWNLAMSGYLTSDAPASPRTPRAWRASGKVPEGRPEVVDLRLSVNPKANAEFHARLEAEARQREQLVQHRLAVEEDDEEVEDLDEFWTGARTPTRSIPSSAPSRFFAPQVVSDKPPIRRPGSTDFLAIPSRSGFTRA